MTSYSAEAKTKSASRYLQQLCKHWSHKFEVSFDETHGRIPFDADNSCTLDAGPETLSMKLAGSDEARVTRLCEVVSEHLKRFAFREELDIAWSRDEAA